MNSELIDQKFTTTKKVELPEFMYAFLNNISDLYSLTGSELKVLMACCKEASFHIDEINNSNIIIVNRLFMDRIREDGFNVSNATIYACLSILAKKEFLIRKARSCYSLNPKYFFKGCLKDINIKA